MLRLVERRAVANGRPPEHGAGIWIAALRRRRDWGEVVLKFCCGTESLQPELSIRRPITSPLIPGPRKGQRTPRDSESESLHWLFSRYNKKAAEGVQWCCQMTLSEKINTLYWFAVEKKSMIEMNNGCCEVSSKEMPLPLHSVQRQSTASSPLIA